MPQTESPALIILVDRLTGSRFPEGYQRSVTGELYSASVNGVRYEAYTLDLLKARVRYHLGSAVEFRALHEADRKLPLNWN